MNSGCNYRKSDLKNLKGGMPHESSRYFGSQSRSTMKLQDENFIGGASQLLQISEHDKAQLDKLALIN